MAASAESKSCTLQSGTTARIFSGQSGCVLGGTMTSLKGMANLLTIVLSAEGRMLRDAKVLNSALSMPHSGRRTQHFLLTQPIDRFRIISQPVQDLLRVLAQQRGSGADLAWSFREFHRDTDHLDPARLWMLLLDHHLVMVHLRVGEQLLVIVYRGA